MKKQLAIVPAHNESASVGRVVRAIAAAAPDFDVLVVDDASTDDTASVAFDSGAKVVTHSFSLGVGGAKQSGYVYALDHGYRLAAVVDGDGQHDPGAIAAMIDGMHSTGADVVCGSRYTGEGSYRQSVSRAAGSRLLAWVLSRATGQRITDPTSGFRLCNRRAIEQFALDRAHDRPEEPAVLMARTHGLRFAEVPVQMHERTEGRSSIGAWSAVYYIFKAMMGTVLGTFRSPATAAPLDLRGATPAPR